MSDSPQSPPKDVDLGAQSPDDGDQMNDPNDPHSGLGGYELAEGVKEQDRWLPIANGTSDPLPWARSRFVRSPVAAFSSFDSLA